MQVLVCINPEDASAHMRTKFPGHQILHERKVKQEVRCRRQGGKHICTSEPMVFFFTVVILKVFLNKQLPTQPSYSSQKLKDRQQGAACRENDWLTIAVNIVSHTICAKGHTS